MRTLNCGDNLDNDNSKDCLDPDCCGKIEPGDRPCCTPPAEKTADQCCADANSKYACDTSRNQCYRTCSSNEQCQQGYCCDIDPKIDQKDWGSGNCDWGSDSPSRIYNNKYLCDPPSWEAEEKQDLNRIPLFFFSSFNPFT